MDCAAIIELVKQKFGDHFVERAAIKDAKPLPAPERPKPLPQSANILRNEIEVKTAAIFDVLKFLRNDSRLEFDFLHCLSGTDYDGKGPLGVTYILTSICHKHWVAINTRVDRERPKVPSVVAIWPAADWHEREAYDLVGIIFEGHPDLKRILCADDWEGHPLRKDYVFPDKYHGIPTAAEVRWNS